MSLRRMRRTAVLRYTARVCAAWHKAFGYCPSATDLAPILGIASHSASGRLYDAERAGFVRLAVDEGQLPKRWRAVPEHLPGYLLEERPHVDNPLVDDMLAEGRPRILHWDAG